MVGRKFGRGAALIDNRREATMYPSIEHTTHPISSAAFFGLELDAHAAHVEDLASKRAAWLDQRPSEELAGLGVPTQLADPGSVRSWNV
jgi:hypothetical protein